MRFLPAVLLVACLTYEAAAQKDSALYVRSASKLTMLGYGLGEDRLGGAKAGYIDSNIVLQIVDSTKDQYLVKLSRNHNAYVSKLEVKQAPVKARPFYLTNSWSIRGDDHFDYVNINLDEKLPYKSWMEINPARIIIDIYGVQSNSNWINQLRNVREVQNVYFNQVEDDVVRVTIELKHATHWGYTIRYVNNSLAVRIRRQPRKLRLNKMIVGVDAGHGGTNTGATGVNSKVLEKNYTIRFATELENYLQRRGVGVIMTRTADTTLLNTDRVLMLQESLPDALVSIHLNSSSLPTVNGVSTYYKHVAFRSMSQSILDNMLDLGLHEFGNVGNFNFTLNAPTDFPNALVEVAFLSNAADEKRILDPRFHKQVAKKIYLGMKEWLRNIRRNS